MLSTLLILAIERVPVAIAALLLALVLGGMFRFPRRRSYPLFWLLSEVIFFGLVQKLYRPSRTSSALMFRGTFLTLSVCAFSLLVSIGIGYLNSLYPHYRLIDVFVVTMTLTSGALWISMISVLRDCRRRMERKGGNSKDHNDPCMTLSVLSGKSLKNADEHAVIRCAVETMAFHFDRGIVSPVFWYVVGGIPLLVLFSTLSGVSRIMQESLASKGSSDDHKRTVFVFMTRGALNVMGFVPNIITGVIIILSAFFTSGIRFWATLRAFFLPHLHASYLNGGIALTLYAYALDVSLGGSRKTLSGLKVQAPWIGGKNASAKAKCTHLERALFLSLAGMCVLVMVLCSLYVGPYRAGVFKP